MILPVKLSVQNKTLKHFPAENRTKGKQIKAQMFIQSHFTSLRLISFHSNAHLVVQ